MDLEDSGRAGVRATRWLISGRARVSVGHTAVLAGFWTGLRPGGPHGRAGWNTAARKWTKPRGLNLRDNDAVRSEGQMRTKRRGLNLRDNDAVRFEHHMRTKPRGLNLRDNDTVRTEGLMRTKRRGLNLRDNDTVRSERQMRTKPRGLNLRDHVRGLYSVPALNAPRERQKAGGQNISPRFRHSTRRGSAKRLGGQNISPGFRHSRRLFQVAGADGTGHPDRHPRFCSQSARPRGPPGREPVQRPGGFTRVSACPHTFCQRSPLSASQHAHSFTPPKARPEDGRGALLKKMDPPQRRAVFHPRFVTLHQMTPKRGQSSKRSCLARLYLSPAQPYRTKIQPRRRDVGTTPSPAPALIWAP